MWVVLRSLLLCVAGFLAVFAGGPAKAQHDAMPAADHTSAPDPSSAPQDPSDAQRGIGHPAFSATLGTLLEHSVAELSAEGLVFWQGSAAHQAPVLLDARALEEYRVSHLAGARWVGYEDFDLQRVSDLDTGRQIVVYCSVGYRSEKVAERLRDAGFQNIYNLYGGIFEWSNRRQPVVDMQGRSTDRVHAYNKTWGVFLRRGTKVFGKEAR